MQSNKKTLGLSISVLLASLSLASGSALAGTKVRVQSNLGAYTLELYDQQAPATVAQFLANIEAGTYHFSMIHAVSNVFFAGGLYFYNTCEQGPVLAPTPPSSPLESTGFTNDLGTIAMIPNSSNPSTLSGQWIINLANNEGVFESSLTPVVFGEVVEGLQIADAVIDLWRVPMDISGSVPTLNYDGIQVVQCGLFTADNVLKVAMEILPDEPPVTAEPANVFDNDSSLLNIKVNAGADGLLALSLQLQATEPSIIVQALPETVNSLTAPVEGMATFDAATGNLTIPELVIDGQVAYTNLVFLLTNVESLFFTLQSFSTP